MPFTVEEFQDLVRLLGERPEWRAELRRHVLSEELLELPALVRQLAEAQARTEQRLDELAQAQARTERRLEELAQAQARTERRLEELAQAQARTERRLEELAQQVGVLAEAQARTEQRLAALAELVDRLGARFDQLADEVVKLVRAHGRTADRVGDLHGYFLEWRYRERADAYFGSLLRRLRVHRASAIVDQYEEQLPPEAMDELLRADLLLQGQPRRAPERGEVWLVVEVSATVDVDDVNRALRRAEILRQVGLRAVPAVAGERATEGAAHRAGEQHVLLLRNGATHGWEEALAAWAT